MRKRRGILFLVILFFSALTFATPLSKIVVFGDSLSDNGNLYEYFKHQLPPSPPYYKGRFTNGPVWVELLAKSYYPADWQTHLLDYAFGGAGVSYDESLGDASEDGVMFTLSREIDSYLLSHKDTADENSLFAVWMGSNNYLATYNSPTKTAHDVNIGIRKSLERLVAKGARHILVINIPDMGKSPAARLFYAEKDLSLSSSAHNIELQRTIDELRKSYSDVQWILFDADKEFAKALANPAEYGYTNTTDTCYQALLGEPSSKVILNMASTIVEPNKPKDACDGFFFFDPIHPSALTHELMAKKLAELLKESNVSFG